MELIFILALIGAFLFLVAAIKASNQRREREKQVTALHAAAAELSKKKRGLFW